MSPKSLDATAVFSSNLTFINELFSQYLNDKNSVSSDWQNFFAANFDDLNLILKDNKGPSWANRGLKVVAAEEYDISSNTKKELPKKDPKAAAKEVASAQAPVAVSGNTLLSVQVGNLILAYKRFGHLAANLDPLNLCQPKAVAELTLEFHNIKNEDLGKEVELNGLLGLSRAKVSDVVDLLNKIYKSTIGSQFTYLNDAAIRDWLAVEIENTVKTPFSRDEKIKILKEIIRTEKFEQFIHKRFPGAKRFSVEGGDASIPAVEKIIDFAAKDGVKKIIVGMAHRGRLNILTGVMGKPYHQVISEFQGTPGIPEELTASGDVKYHMGFSSTRQIAGNKIDLSLAFNPSHLEVVNPVIAGRVRATGDMYKDASRLQAMALLIHGDAAFAGQGSVAESLMMSGIKGYDVGGIMHIIINNQIGFTANPENSRSTLYASDLAKGIDAPIFHVNGDDAEAVVRVASIITKYRQTFKKDVVMDLICYRRYGHNEGDEPMYTQPIMYTAIKAHPTLEKIYSDQLIAEGVITAADYQKLVDEFNDHLNKEFDLAPKYKAPAKGDWLKGDWKNIKVSDPSIPETGVAAKKLKDIAAKINFIPSTFNANPKIAKQYEDRLVAIENGGDIDWGNGEALAFGTLLSEGFPVRITGQDSGRGTFSHRHSVLHSMNGEKFVPLNNLEGQKNNPAAKYEVHDSILSELGVLGFEYGYSLSDPNSLVIWEAQFGDFANGAQMIFDQFIVSSEVKWLRKSGLVCLLPHGFEGQGPEHSSARLERFLQMCANDNIRVCNITNPANFFHALRRQIHSGDRKPLIVMSPKSLLRHKLAVSKLEDFTKGGFKTVLPEAEKLVANDKVRKIVLCSGKVYYDLLAARGEKKINDVALIRLEQLYPFPSEELASEIKKYKNAEIIWCQEEPKNMGSWSFINELVEETLVGIKHKVTRAKYAGRVASASPATGYGSYHAREQKALIEEALK